MMKPFKELLLKKPPEMLADLFLDIDSFPHRYHEEILGGCPTEGARPSAAIFSAVRKTMLLEGDTHFQCEIRVDDQAPLPFTYIQRPENDALILCFFEREKNPEGVAFIKTDGDIWLWEPEKKNMVPHKIFGDYLHEHLESALLVATLMALPPDAKPNFFRHPFRGPGL